MKHIICFSGGHSSALVSLEVANRYGTENMILLNHDISSKVELEDIKRFKREVAEYLGLTITYANYKDFEEEDQFDLAVKNGSFGLKTKNIPLPVCTTLFKTKPFYNYLDSIEDKENYIIHYGFDPKERNRIVRRQEQLTKKGFKTDYPLALWYEQDLLIYQKMDQLNLFNDNLDRLNFVYSGNRKYKTTLDIGIKPPSIYKNYKHANCIGCLKGSKQHWYIVYCLNNDIFKKAKETEIILNSTILQNISLTDLEPIFKKMKDCNIEPNQNIDTSTFWYLVKKKVNTKVFDEESLNSCNLFECTG